MLSARHPDPGYSTARAFYRACGFVVLEELPTLWGPDNPAVQLGKALSGRPAGRSAGDVHHVELWVADLSPATERWGWLLGELGYDAFQDWPARRSWRRGGDEVVLEQSVALHGIEHDRFRPGLNHLAFHARTRAALDRLVAAAPSHGWKQLFAEQYPHAGGPDHEAAYLEDEAGSELELVADRDR